MRQTDGLLARQGWAIPTECGMDGSCAYYSAAYCTRMNAPSAEQTALTLRMRVQEELHSNELLYRPYLPPDHFPHLPPDQQWPEFLAQILQIGTYVDGDIELMALATVLQTHIRILSRSPSDTDTDVIKEVLVTPRYEVGLIYDEDTTPPCQPDLARDGPRGIS